MRSACLVIGAALCGASGCLGAVHTWTGKLSDSMCGAQHKAAMEHAVDSKTSDADCTALCIKNGAKYVFVSGGKSYGIDNQDFPGLQERAGLSVRVTGEMTDNVIKVSKISTNSRAARGEKSSLSE